MLKLPPTVCEVIPGILYVSGSSAVPVMVRDYHVRAVVRCEATEVPWTFYDDHLPPYFTAGSGGGRVDDEQERGGGSSDKLDENNMHDNVNNNNNSSSGAEACQHLQMRRQQSVALHWCPMEDTLHFNVLESPSFFDALDFLECYVAAATTAAEETLADEGAGEQDDIEGGGVTRGDETQQRRAMCTRTVPTVLVHCQAGRSRAPTVVAAFLMVKQGLTLTEALGRMSPLCRPNPAFIDQLLRLEAEVSTSTSSEQTTTTRRSGGADRQPFDRRGYLLEGLSDLFPSLTHDEVESLFDRCNGDVVVARQMLTRLAFERQKDRVAVECLLALLLRDGSATTTTPTTSDDKDVGQQQDPPLDSECTPRWTLAEVEERYQRCGRDRHAALRMLLEEDKERRQGCPTTTSAPSS